MRKVVGSRGARLVAAVVFTALAGADDHVSDLVS